ncbi:Type 2A phosphatase activator TIP41 [Talaromyces islandicus]|uniref:Type 2A phosphatase activator TIP41 n=1 Tax=Talaromyces islandicus TaxID=28573 RepID=A0A0U1M4B9_TALIS|nr:Type 2A phosphatase activator TIP41 [Talaromyces islandicus]
MAHRDSGQHPAAMNGQPPSKPNAFVRKGFKITTQKLPILKSGPIEDMTKNLGIAPPEMIFGDNFVTIEHPASAWGIAFNAFDALDRVDKTGSAMLKVAYSKEWQKSREHTHEGIKDVVKPFDWSYSTDFKGTLRPESPPFSPTNDQIPIELLKRPDPILFFDDVILYEDELADNGISMLSCKIRVMPERLLLLSRFFMRLDNVVVRLRDTRIYVDFDKAEVIRDYQAREMSYEDARKVLAGAREDVSAAMRDPNRLAQVLPLVENTLERVSLGTRTPAQLGFATSARSYAAAKPSSDLMRKWAEGSATGTYVSYGFTEKLFEACSAQADYRMPKKGEYSELPPKAEGGEDVGIGEGLWYSELGLLPTFSTWSQVTFLHMYLLTVRLRAVQSVESFQTHSQHLFDHFSHNAEHRMATLHDLSSRGIRNRYLKDLFIQWRGILAAYDEGLVKGDAVLGAAVWRNIWKASSTDYNGKDIDWAKIASVVGYMRRVLSELAQTPEVDLANSPKIFGLKKIDTSLARKN